MSVAVGRYSGSTWPLANVGAPCICEWIEREPREMRATTYVQRSQLQAVLPNGETRSHALLRRVGVGRGCLES